MMRINPKELTEVLLLCGCGSIAIETAYKIAFSHYRKTYGGNERMGILSFNRGFHGRSMGALTTTSSKAVNKVGVPAFDWPRAPFPLIQYPYRQFETENLAEEQRCLGELEKVFKETKDPIAGVIIEPIMGEGGDKLASPTFYLGVQEITHKHNALLIADEVQTGGWCTGRVWGHEH